MPSPLLILWDDATVLAGMRMAAATCFREQAQLIDRLFVYRFEEFEKRLDEKWEKRFDEKFEEKFEQKFEKKFEEKFQPVRAQLNTIEDLVKTVLSRLN